MKNAKERTVCKVKNVTLLCPNRVAVELSDGRIKLVDLILLEDGIYASRERIKEKVMEGFKAFEPDMLVIAER